MRNVTGYNKYMTESEYKQIKHYVEGLESPSMKACILTMMTLGLRCSDAIKLKRSDFNADFSKVVINQQKTRKILELPIPDYLRGVLVTFYYRFNNCMIDDFLFFASWRNQSKNSHIQVRSIVNVFSDIRKHYGWDTPYYTTKNGVKLFRLSSHCCRHFIGSRIYAVAGLKAAQEFLGHSKIETTAKYVSTLYDLERKAEAIEEALNF